LVDELFVFVDGWVELVFECGDVGVSGGWYGLV